MRLLSSGGSCARAAEARETKRMLFIVQEVKGKLKVDGEDTRFLPGEESCKEAIRRTGLDTTTNNLRL